MPEEGTPGSGQGSNTGNGGDEDAQAQQMLADATRTFTQDDVDKVVKERLARERGKFADYDQLKEKAAEYDKLAEAQKTEAQKAAERAEQAEQRATTAEMAQLKLDVAFDKAPEGLGVKQVRAMAKRLTGSTREELEADAEELFGELPTAQSNGGGGSRRPVESLRSGGSPAGGEAHDMNEWMRGRAPRK